ncbi:MAG: PAS domain S-box protein [Bacteroidales bacterium]|nr:PAS domain S-box protein [Bacteroidales bacterium]
MKTDILHLIDFKRIDALLEGFNKSTGFVTAILDLEGKVLSKSGWRLICTDFHRVNPETSKRCTISDAELANEMLGGKKYHCYSCHNGLMDAAVPLVIKGEHVANLFTGQFFFEKPDINFFKKQAKEFGFDEQKYLEALSKVPVVSKEKVKVVMDFLLNMTQLIGDLALQKLEQTELIQKIGMSEQKYRLFFESNPQPMWVYDLKTLKFLEVNNAAVKKYGYSNEEFLSMTIKDIRPEEDIDNLMKNIHAVGQGLDEAGVWRHCKKDGSMIYVEITSHTINFENRKAELVLANDITRRIQTEKVLEYQRLLISDMGKVAKIGGWEFDAISGKGTWTEETARIHDVDPDDETNVEKGISFYKPASHRKIEKAIKEAIELGIPYNIELGMVSAKGIEKWVQTIGRPIEENGKVVRVRGSFQDITERKMAEEALIESEQKFRNLFQDHAAVKLIIDPENGKIVEANKAAAEFYGWSIEDLQKMNIAQINVLPPSQLKKEIEKARSLNKIQFEFKHRKADGKLVDVEVFSSSINIEGKQFLHSIIHDISEKKKAEEKIHLLSKAIESSSVSVVITDSMGDINYVNQFFTELTGYTREEVYGNNPRVLRSGHQPEEFYKNLWKTILSGSDWQGEILNKKKNGELFWAKAFISPITNSLGKISHFISIEEDITERKRMLDDLVAAKEKAEKSDKLKTAFLNNISHEIKTPLNGILGFGQFLADPGLSADKRAEMLVLVQRSANRLMNTVTDYMDMAMLFSGTMEARKKEFVLNSLFEDIIKNTKQLCAEKNIDFKVEIPRGSDGLTINSDPEFIRRIMDNLLDNALKFTMQGGITCGYRIKPGFVGFFVQDTGKGIDEDNKKLIFDMFTQEDLSLTRGYEGSGLGLSLAKGMVRLLGGNITVSSEKSKGSTFTFSVPIGSNITSEPMSTYATTRDTGIKKPLILVAEDDDLNFRYIESVLKLENYNYLHAKNGSEAVDYCKKNPEISLVLMDIKMPFMNGFDASRQIRDFRPKLPIIATTAYAQTGDEHRILAAGCTDYLAKPIKKDDLLAAINKYI